MEKKEIVGIDIGAETIKVVGLELNEKQLGWTKRFVREHQKNPEKVLIEILKEVDWNNVSHAAVTGRLSRNINLQRIPIKQAQAAGFRHLFPEESAATIVSIGSHGFSVLELRGGEESPEVFRENSRCSQGTGNFLRQLVERFDLSIDEASETCATIDDPAPLSGRCPVILKTDMTHLANKGEPRSRILAGLYDAVCENVQVLIKPRISPPRHVLIGGVSRSSRIQDHFQGFLARHEMELLETQNDDSLYFEALGAALIAWSHKADAPAIDELVGAPEDHPLETLPALSQYLENVKRMPQKPLPQSAEGLKAVILGYDIGSTGSKVVAVDPRTKEPLWEGYINTNGAPVKAAQALTQQFLDGPFGKLDVIGVGTTGSGREIVGSLMTTCFGSENIFILNEIAAHAEGALHYEPKVDTIFEIGGQDAKYIRLSEGRVVDAAMNEACSAGTGSFIEEQGKKFDSVKNVVHLGETALDAQHGISLGQHCSVFMAEIIDEAVAAGEKQPNIIAGIYDSIIQNYLNRVKGNRSVGSYIFCQGMPFSSDALAAAVVRQTGSQVIVPPNPGTVGALGIALLTLKEKTQPEAQHIDMSIFLSAQVAQKDVFVCKSTKGCGGSGNKCRIDRIRTVVEGQKQTFTWGGGCSLYDKGTGKKKLPDLTPDPFREREALVQDIQARCVPRENRPKVAITDEFTLKGLFPFFATYIYALGLDLEFHTGATQETLKLGIEGANVPFCAPMQQYHGLVSKMAGEDTADYLFLPMVRQLPRVKEETWARLCPIVQGSADILKTDLDGKAKSRIISPVINIGPKSLESQIFLNSCMDIAKQLGVNGDQWEVAYQNALETQNTFDERCLELGQHALDFCKEKNITPVVLLGRAYTIYNTVLNSNVPAILREQGTVPIPVDCYPISEDTPIFERMYWGYGQRNLRALYDIRRREGVYSLYCSNYSCGPDSFTIHFYGYLMEGKPYSVIETDGHSGDAGTKTRIEAFLYCVGEDLKRGQGRAPRTIDELEHDSKPVDQIVDHGDVVLIPRMGDGTEALVTCMRGIGVNAEALPLPTKSTLAEGRRYTSGKECIPMTLTLGALLERVAAEKDENTHFTFFMPTANGPCRFGTYHLLHNIILEQLGLRDKISFWSPVDEGYFESAPDGFAALIFTGFVASDLLQLMLLDTRPIETRKGAADELYEFYNKELLALLDDRAHKPLNNGIVISQTVSGHLFGIPGLLARAAKAFKEIQRDQSIPTVLVVGEIYVRSDPFSNDYVIKKLEARGIRARFAVFSEWIEYTDYQDVRKSSMPEYIEAWVQASIQTHLHAVVEEGMGWPERTTVQDSIQAASPYIREQLSGEAVLTLGGPVHEWRHGHIDGVVSVGPLECMPNKIAESQFFHVAENEGLRSLTLNLNGDPIDPEILDNFAYEIHAEHKRKLQGKTTTPPPKDSRAPKWKTHSRVNHHS